MGINEYSKRLIIKWELRPTTVNRQIKQPATVWIETQNSRGETVPVNQGDKPRGQNQVQRSQHPHLRVFKIVKSGVRNLYWRFYVLLHHGPSPRTVGKKALELPREVEPIKLLPRVPTELRVPMFTFSKNRSCHFSAPPPQPVSHYRKKRIQQQIYKMDKKK